MEPAGQKPERRRPEQAAHAADIGAERGGDSRRHPAWQPWQNKGGLLGNDMLDGLIIEQKGNKPIEIRTNGASRLVIDGDGIQIKDVVKLEPRPSAPVSPTEGDVYMDSTTHKLLVYDGTTWQACW